MANHNTLTSRQREIYDYIRNKIEARGYPPTVREIGDAFGIKSPNGVMCHLNALEKKRLINRDKQSARAIQLVDRTPGGGDLPLVGAVAAGAPIAATTADDRFNFTDMFCGPDHFVLKVRGTSMIDDHIADGDYVVIRGQKTAENGERVVAMIDNEVTLKKFYSKHGRVILEPCNDDMDPIVIDPESDAQVIGVLVGVLRRCR